MCINCLAGPWLQRASICQKGCPRPRSQRLLRQQPGSRSEGQGGQAARDVHSPRRTIAASAVPQSTTPSLAHLVVEARLTNSGWRLARHTAEQGPRQRPLLLGSTPRWRKGQRIILSGPRSDPGRQRAGRSWTCRGRLLSAWPSGWSRTGCSKTSPAQRAHRAKRRRIRVRMVSATRGRWESWSARAC